MFEKILSCFGYSKKTIKYVPGDIERINEFFFFCARLEEHPFFKSHMNGGQLRLRNGFTKASVEEMLNFDVVHLESLLSRIRQFIFTGEMFYNKEVRRSAIKIFGEYSEFKKFYDKIVTEINKKIPPTNIKVFKTNGKEVVAGYTYKELVEAVLYTGLMHSERRLNPEQGSSSDGLVNAPTFVQAHLLFEMADLTLGFCEIIFSFRWMILLAASHASKESLCPQLEILAVRGRQKLNQELINCLNQINRLKRLKV